MSDNQHEAKARLTTDFLRGSSIPTTVSIPSDDGASRSKIMKSHRGHSSASTVQSQDSKLSASSSKMSKSSSKKSKGSSSRQSRRSEGTSSRRSNLSSRSSPNDHRETNTSHEISKAKRRSSVGYDFKPTVSSRSSAGLARTVMGTPLSSLELFPEAFVETVDELPSLSELALFLMPKVPPKEFKEIITFKAESSQTGNSLQRLSSHSQEDTHESPFKAEEHCGVDDCHEIDRIAGSLRKKELKELSSIKLCPPSFVQCVDDMPPMSDLDLLLVPTDPLQKADESSLNNSPSKAKEESPCKPFLGFLESA